MPDQENKTGSVFTAKFVGVLSILTLVAVVLMAGLYWYGIGNLDEESRDDRAFVAGLREQVKDNLQNTEYEEAVRLAEDIKNSPDASPNQKARAIISTANIHYKLSGDIKDAIKTVQDLKEIIADEAVGSETKVTALTTMAKMYSQTGENKEVFEEIFKGDPYYSFLIPDDPVRSIRTLLEWGYATSKSSRAAVAISSLYVKDLLNNANLPKTTADNYTQSAKHYLKEATNLLEREVTAEGSQKNRRKYAGYFFWRAFIVAGLDYLGDEEYKSTYKDEYENFFLFLDEQGTKEMEQYSGYAHWIYAVFLIEIDNDAQSAKKHLDAVVDFVDNDERPEINEFVWYVKNRKSDGSIGKDFISASILDMGNVSPRFANFIDSIEPW